MIIACEVIDPKTSDLRIRLFTGRARILTFFFLFVGFLLNNIFLLASKPRFFNASGKGTPLILSLATPGKVAAIAFPILGNNGNKPVAKRIHSPPTLYPLCIIVPEYTGIPLPLCKHVGKDTSVIFLFKV